MYIETIDLERHQRELRDRLEIAEFVTTTAMLGDNHAAGDWERYTQRYAERVEVDYGATLGDRRREISRDTLMPYWRSMVAAFDMSQHLVTNVIVSLSGDTASTRAYVVTYHRIGNDLWTCGGIYEHGVRRAPRGDGGWTVTAQRFTPLHDSGDRSVLDRGIARALPSPFRHADVV